MGKRKLQDSDEEIRKKIRKLERKLNKKNIYRRIMIQSSDDEMNDNSTKDIQPAATRSVCPEPGTSALSPFQDSCCEEEGGDCSRPVYSRSPSPIPTVEDPYENPIPSTSANKDVILTEDMDLGEDILHLLGDAPKPEKALGPSIHKDIASRWQEILAKGMGKEVKCKLLEEYLVPSNCDLLTAPILNPEAKAALPEIKLKRDSSLLNKQTQLGIALSALAYGMELIISNETSKQKILKPISDAGRILCDIHFSDTKLRRDFVVNSINTKLKETLVDTTRDKYLFGDNVTEKLKATKTIQQSGQSLKATNFRTPFYKNNLNSRPNVTKNNLNYKRQPRNYNITKSNEAAPTRQAPAPRTSRPGNSYNPRMRSPPRKTRRR